MLVIRWDGDDEMTVRDYNAGGKRMQSLNTIQQTSGAKSSSGAFKCCYTPWLSIEV